MVWKTRYSVRWPTHMSQPRRISRWVWKVGSVKTTASPCTRVSRDGIICHTEGAPDLLGECQRHESTLKIQGLPSGFPPEITAKVQISHPGESSSPYEETRPKR